MRLTRLLLARSFKRRDGIISGYHPQPDLVSALGKYTKDYSNLPERFIVRKSTRLLYKSEREPNTPPEIELAPIMHHAMERPWNDDYWAKYTYDPKEEYGYIVEPVREEDWMWFRGDRVEIVNGEDKGKQGYINYVVQERNWVMVEGLNCKYEIMGKTESFPGMCLKREQPLVVTGDIKLVDPSDEKATDVEWRFMEDCTRVRVSTRTGHIIPMPSKAGETVDYKTKAGYSENKEKDTLAKDAEAITYDPKLATFEMDIMEQMGIKENRTPKKTWWY